MNYQELKDSLTEREAAIARHNEQMALKRNLPTRTEPGAYWKKLRSD